MTETSNPAHPTPFQRSLVQAMGKIFLWIRLAASEPAPGRVIAGLYVDLHKAEGPSACRIPGNVPDGQKIAFVLSDLAHNMADVVSGKNDFFAAEYFAHECQRVARMEFAAQCWGRISAGLLKLAEAFNAASATGESGGTDA
ncbi:hypothetical protein [Insolitispirillum peregrinum]|uniref:Uncharacterized protein n=1 Tax=Insolitispirillum peregrinum TaxID=80876 RepID=A0A1N7MG85_9PROT|nr:hypothetical protein [Insolitispirillum peregrinum]SIS85154.1 hypothetical protein SAMN05421779_104106 [Insolitispirillum peregrinum]